MAKLLLDELRAIIEPLLPPPSPGRDRPLITNRPALTGVLFVLKTDLPWEDLPAGMSCGSVMSRWRRLAAWQADGTWETIHAARLEGLANAGEVVWLKAVIGSSGVRAGFEIRKFVRI